MTDRRRMTEVERRIFGLEPPPTPSIPETGVASTSLGSADPIRQASSRPRVRRDIFAVTTNDDTDQEQEQTP